MLSVFRRCVNVNKAINAIIIARDGGNKNDKNPHSRLMRPNHSKWNGDNPNTRTMRIQTLKHKMAITYDGTMMPPVSTCLLMVMSCHTIPMIAMTKIPVSIVSIFYDCDMKARSNARLQVHKPALTGSDQACNATAR